MLLSQRFIADHQTYSLNSLPFPVRAVDRVLRTFPLTAHLAYRQHYIGGSMAYFQRINFKESLVDQQQLPWSIF